MSLLGNTLVRSRTLPGCLIATLLLLATYPSPSLAQSDDAPEATANESVSPKTAFSNPFSKLFARKPSEESEQAPKPSRPTISLKPGSTLFRPGRSKPAQPEANPARPEEGAAAEPQTRGGLLVPLKSFTNRVFRQSADEPVESDDSPSLPPPTPSTAAEEPSRPFREPFKNLPRPRFAPNREESEIELEEIVVPPPSPTRSPKSTPPLDVAPPVVSRSAPGSFSTPDADDSPLSYQGAGTPAKSDISTRSDGAGSSAPNARLPVNNSSRRSSDSSPLAPSPSPSIRTDKDDAPSLIDLSSDSSSKTSSTTIARNPSNANSPSPGPSHGKNLGGINSNGNNSGVDIPSGNRSTATAPIHRPIETAKADEVDVPRVFTSRSKNTKVPSQPISSRAVKAEEPLPLPTAPPSAMSTIPSKSPAISPNQFEASPPQQRSPQKGPNLDTRSTKSSLGMMQLPGVRVSVQGPDALLVGQDATFEILAKNEGNVDLNGLLLRISVPSSVEVGQLSASHGQSEPENAPEENAIGWEIPKLQAGGQVSLRITLRTIKPEHFAMGIEWTAVPQSQEYAIRVQQPQLEVALEGPSEAEFGTPQNYRLRVRNPGNAVAKNVEVVLQAGNYGSNQSKVGDVPPGDEKVIDVELLFEQNGTIPVSATARSDSAKLEAKGEIQVKVKQAVLEATWTGPSEFFQGTSAEYRVTVVNRGDVAASNAECSLKIPDGASPSNLPSGAIRKGNTIHWDIKRLQPQESVSFPFGLAMNETGGNVLEFTAACKNGLPLSSSHTTLIDSIVDLKLTVKDPIAPAPVGHPVVYEIEIHNRGSKAATGVQVLAQFSEGIEPVRFEGAEGRIQPGQVLFEPIGNVDAGTKVTLRVFAEASQQGVHRFRAEVKCDAGDANLLQEESTRFLASGPIGTED